MRRALRHGLLGAALTVFTLAVTLGPILVVPAVVPGFGGQVGGLAVSLTVVGTLGSLVALAASVGIGYREQHHYGVRDEYRRFAAALGCGGGAVVLLAVLALGVAGTLTTVSLALVVAMVLSVFVAMPVVVVVAALAGVTVAALPTDWRRADRPFGRPLVVPVGAALVAGGSIAVDSSTRLLLSLSSDPTVPAWLPRFGTIGVTATVYSSLDGAAGGVVLVAGAFVLGAYAARRHGFDESVRRFAVLVSVGVVLAPLATTAAVTGTSLAEFFGSNGGVAFGVASLSAALVETALVATLAALAGLGVATVNAGDGDGTTAASAGVGDSAGDDPSVVDRDGRSELSAVDEAPR